jgi:hypothetical protein
MGKAHAHEVFDLEVLALRLQVDPFVRRQAQIAVSCRGSQAEGTMLPERLAAVAKDTIRKSQKR